MSKLNWGGWWFSEATSTPESKQLVTGYGDHAAAERQAEDLMNEGNPQAAEDIYRELIAAGSNNHIVYGNLAKICGMQGRFDELAGLLKKALELNPDYPEAHNYLGNSFKQRGNLLAAIAAYSAAIQLNPGYPNAHNNLGIALREKGDLTAAIAAYKTALELQYDFPEAHKNLGNAFKEQGDLVAAIACYKTALELQPDFAEAHNNLGNALKEQGNLEAAIACYNTALEVMPNSPGIHNNLGNIFSQKGDLTAAIAAYKAALELQHDFPEAHNNLGNVFKEQGDLTAAIACYNTALELQPDFAEAHNNFGTALQDQGKLDSSITAYKTALELRPNYPGAYNNLGTAFGQRGDLAAAIACYNTALELQPAYPEAQNNLGNALKEQGDLTGAIACYNAALELQPNFAEAHNNLGNAFKEQGDLTAAIACYNIALEVKPNSPGTYNNLGNAFNQKGDLAAAIAAYSSALELQFNYPYAAGMLATLRCQICDWSELASLVSRICQGVSAGEQITPPFALLALVDAPHLHRQAAATWACDQIAAARLSPLVAKSRDAKIHIAYLSADFHDHATSYLMAELFELHDRDRFELTAISFGPAESTTMRQRVAAAFDRFEDVCKSSDMDIARLCREIGVDIAVDLKGFTAGYRAGILANRCAPIQINWLGYPGTMAAPFMDYIVADPTLISEEDFGHYSEKVIRLPDSYQVNDSKRRINDKTLTRAEFGLPEIGFVFCCFNNNYKILPEVFDVWMRILNRVPGSVLWLLGDNLAATDNLRREALARGIAVERLVFACRCPIDEHLARHRLADLFIDTWPYNAHTTASDALWSGLPVLTREGRSFASRVAASLLQAIGLPELITRSDQHYEDLAVALAQDPVRLHALQQKLAANRLIQPLFNCERFTRSLESAFEQVMERYWAGTDPDHLSVAPEDSAV